MKRYRRRPGTDVTAVRLQLDTEGFTYRKWRGDQTCKPGDWIVDNGEDVYTVNPDTFRATYHEVGPGRFAKHGDVWATVADQAGRLPTQTGTTEYEAGYYLVYNDPDGRDGWAMKADRFKKLYEPADGGAPTS